MHFDVQYSFPNVHHQAWVVTVEVGMMNWKAINSVRSTRESSL